MKHTRKRNKKYGGKTEGSTAQEHKSEMFKYAMLMKNKKDIDANKFQKYLETLSNPLHQLYDFNNYGILYTINEYALIYDADVIIQSSFNNNMPWNNT